MDKLLKESVQYLKGVGPSRVKQLEKLGINTVYDLLTHFPREYENRNNIKRIQDFMVGENVVFIARVSTRPEIRRKGRGFSLTYFYASDDTGRIRVTIFNQPYLNDKLEIDKEFVFYGKVEESKGRFEIVNPVIVEKEKMDSITGFYPIYPLTAGIKNGYIAKLVNELLDKKYVLPEILSNELRKKYNLCEVNFALEQIHRPTKFENIEIARIRLIFEELFLLQLALLSLRNRNFEEKTGIKFEDTDYTEFLKILPFELTGAQQRVVSEIIKDMGSTRPMNRLVQGDVGSGKTIVAALAMYVAVKNGYQATLMAPTTILATQHYEELKKYFSHFGMTCDLLTGSTTPKNKRIILEKLKNGEIDILIGTNALVSDNVEFKNCGLVITDEQHRFGVKQRMKLNAKGENPDVVVMTATPIPRTLALMVYSDLDMSIIDELPKGRIPIKTYVVNETLEERIDKFIAKEMDKGRQVYVVCPLIEENEELDLTDATNVYERYKNEVFKDYSVGFLHGKMKKKEKEEVMQDFKDGKIQMIVSTTVIEVGVNVPNATLMVIENAERFGLATLHQLRGRVGRSSLESYCVLKAKNMGKETRERLGIMVKSNNGFEIAEKDLEIRGPGDFFGIRQHGLPEFKVANLLKDVKLLKLSNDAAKEVLEKDPKFELEENKILKEELFTKYNEQLVNIGT
ncbi:MAG: ATP-dependent DNA helicase RecG [Clostridia bacterium]|nr:ATP-dependent DNA helicase RecG [Clostridia bacterium]